MSPCVWRVSQQGLHAANYTGRSFLNTPSAARLLQRVEAASSGCMQVQSCTWACSHALPRLSKFSAAGCWSALHAEGRWMSSACTCIQVYLQRWCLHKVPARSPGPKLLLTGYHRKKRSLLCAFTTPIMLPHRRLLERVRELEAGEQRLQALEASLALAAASAAAAAAAEAAAAAAIADAAAAAAPPPGANALDPNPAAIAQAAPERSSASSSSVGSAAAAAGTRGLFDPDWVRAAPRVNLAEGFLS